MNNRENIYSLKGFWPVFRFTARQTFKNKAYVASFVIFVLVMTFMGPLQYAGRHAGQGAATSSLEFHPESARSEKVYVVNQTGVELKLDDLGEMYVAEDGADQTGTELAEENGTVRESGDLEEQGILKSNIVILNAGESSEEVLDKLGERDSAVVLTEDETGYHVNGIIADDSEVEVDEIDTIAGIVTGAFDRARLASSNISEEDIRMITRSVGTDGTISEKQYLEEKSREISEDRYFMYILGFAMIMFVVVSMSTSYIITSVTEEKQSKLVESLLVSVRPMALLMGKVLGMMSYVLLVLVFGMIGSNLSKFVMQNVLQISEKEFSSAGFDFSIFVDFGGFGTFIMLLSIVIGFVAFGMLSGLFGSTCNKMEDIQSATGSVMTISMLGYFGSMAVGIADKDIISVIASLLPPFSFFVAPVTYVTGRIGLPVLIISVLLQIILLILIMRLSAKAYRNLLLSDASTPKLATILKSAKGEGTL